MADNVGLSRNTCSGRAEFIKLYENETKGLYNRPGLRFKKKKDYFPLQSVWPNDL